MPSRWIGSVDDRLARLEHVGRRCDGNTRRCPTPAVDEFELWPADGQGNKLPDGKRVKKKSCGRHRIQFIENGQWVVTAMRELPKKSNPSSRPYEAVQARFSTTPNGDEPTWLGFIQECRRIDPTMFGEPTTVDDWWAGGTVEEYPAARVIHRGDDSVSVVSKTFEANEVLRSAARRLNIRLGG